MSRDNISYPKIILTIIAALYFFRYAMTPNDGHLIDGATMIAHEGGHFMFAFFGEFLHVLGGPLMQIAIPILVVYYFYKHEEYFSASFVIFWVGQSLINTSIYEGDAIAQNLPLLVPFGALNQNVDVTNDWTYLLTKIGLLNYTDVISHVFSILGICLIVLAIILCFKYSLNKSDPENKRDLSFLNL